MNAVTYSDTLRAASQPDWDATVGHDFVRALGDGSLPESVFRRYLVQDYRFIETLVSIVGFAVARAPDLPSKTRFAEFLGVLTGGENDYFQRSFEALGVSADDLAETEDSAVLHQFKQHMRQAADAGTYADVLSVLLPAEWIYLEWAQSLAGRQPGPFYLHEWITLHSEPAFAAFVAWMTLQMDQAAPEPGSDGDTRVRKSFAHMVALERAFFSEAIDAAGDRSPEP